MGTLLSLIGMVCLLASAVCSLIILIAAFQEDITQGLLSLCIPFYILYFAFARYESENKGMIIAIWIIGGIVGNVMQVAAAVGAAADAGAGIPF